MSPEGCKPPPLPELSTTSFKCVCRIILQSHTFGFVCLVPAVIMLMVHHELGLTDAFLMGDRKSANYNLVMMAVFFAGIAACVLHTCYLANRGGKWVLLKAILLVLYWAGFLASV